MAAYWIKLYTEMLDDPKVALLPGELYKRMIQLFLLAGRLCDDKSGDLPDTRSIAWLLRMDSDQLQYELEQLAGIGVITEIVGGWNVVNFSKRQAKVEDVERQRQSRKRKAKEIYKEDNEPVTTLSRNVTESRSRIEKNRIETDTEVEAEVETEFQQLLNAFVSESGLLPNTSPSWIESIKTIQSGGYKPDDVVRAIQFNREKGYPVTSPKSILTTISGSKEPARKKTILEENQEVIRNWRNE